MTDGLCFLSAVHVSQRDVIAKILIRCLSCKNVLDHAFPCVTLYVLLTGDMKKCVL